MSHAVQTSLHRYAWGDGGILLWFMSEWGTLDLSKLGWEHTGVGDAEERGTMVWSAVCAIKQFHLQQKDFPKILRNGLSPRTAEHIYGQSSRETLSQQLLRRQDKTSSSTAPPYSSVRNWNRSLCIWKSVCLLFKYSRAISPWESKRPRKITAALGH